MSMPGTYSLITPGGLIQVDGHYEVTPFFKAHELACPDKALIQYEPMFLVKISNLRYECDHGMTLNSAGRTPTYNANLEGAHKNSLHQTLNPKHQNIKTRQALMSCAVDVRTRNWSPQKIKDFVAMAEEHGFSVGIAKTFIHLDYRALAGLPPIRFYYTGAKSWFAKL